VYDTPTGTELNGLLGEKLRRGSFKKAKLSKPPPTRTPESAGLSVEHKEQGRVKRHVYAEYLKAASRIGFLFFMLATIGQQIASVAANLALRSWGEHNQQAGSNSDAFKYLLLFGVLSLSQALLGGIAAIIIYVWNALRSARYLHDKACIRYWVGHRSANRSSVVDA
jgi:ATP-binding cassette, subfamily C (CFTR/MRP), member 1